MWSNAGREMKAAARISQVDDGSGVRKISRTCLGEENLVACYGDWVLVLPLALRPFLISLCGTEVEDFVRRFRLSNVGRRHQLYTNSQFVRTGSNYTTNDIIIKCHLCDGSRNKLHDETALKFDWQGLAPHASPLQPCNRLTGMLPVVHSR